MQSLIAIALAAAAIATGEPPQKAIRTAAAAAGCPEPGALVRGPPAAELFDPYQPAPGVAVWCERYDGEGRSTRNGPYEDRYPSGAPRTRAHFEAGRLEGDVEIRHETGAIWLQSRYEAGVLDGPYLMFRPNGRIWLRAAYVNGARHGPLTLHHPDGTLAAESHYAHGVERGTSRAWWPNGVPRRERAVVDGLWDGPSATWFDTGRVESEGRWSPCAPDAAAITCRLIGSARHGRWHTWHATGHRASRGQYRYGEKVGTWVYWDEAGEPEMVNVHGGDEHVRSIRGTLPEPPPAVSSPPERPADPEGER